MPSFVTLLLSLLIFGILGSTDTSTHMGFVDAFLGWDCEGTIVLLFELESEAGWMDEEVVSLGVPTPLVPR